MDIASVQYYNNNEVSSFILSFDVLCAQQSLEFLPTHASEQGNVIGLVSVYICVYKKKL